MRGARRRPSGAHFPRGAGRVRPGPCGHRVFGGRSYRFIAVSRPGYLRTPAEVGKTPEEQADAFAALLDALKVDKAIMTGISAGGPPSMQFALRHPDRCAALLLVSAVTERIPVPEPKSAGPLCAPSCKRTFSRA